MLKEDILKIETVSDKTAGRRLKNYLALVQKKPNDNFTLCEYAAIKNIDIKELCEFFHVDTDKYNWTLIYEAVENIKKRIVTPDVQPVPAKAKRKRAKVKSKK